MDVTGGSNTYGIYALGGDWQGSETIEIRIWLSTRQEAVFDLPAFGLNQAPL